MKITLTVIAVLLLQSGILAQSSGLPSCEKLNVSNEQRRGFENSSFEIDLDGDGNKDTVKSTVFTRSNSEKAGKDHWIKFDVVTSKGTRLNSFFEYRYGDEHADYWVFVFIPCKINGDEKIDLLFYAGDDTSEEKVLLLNKGEGYKEYSRKTSDLEP